MTAVPPDAWHQDYIPTVEDWQAAFAAAAAAHNLSNRPTVRDYGAVGDGVTDDTTAFNLAIAANGFVLVPYSPTPYVVGSVVINRGVTIVGEGGPNGQATIRPLTTTTTVFDVAAEWVTIENLAISTANPATTKQTAGSYINVRTTANRFRANRLTLTEWHEGITVQGSATVIMTEITALLYSQGVSQSSAAIAVHGGADVRIEGLLANGPNVTRADCLAGIQVDATGDTTIVDSQVIACGTDLLVNPGNGQVVASLWAIGTYFDTAYRGADFTPTGSGAIVRARLSDCWFSSHATNGIRVSAGTDGVDIDSPHVFLNASHGINLVGGIHARVRGGQVAQNGDNGIYVAANVSHWSVEGVTSGSCAGLSGNLNYGVYVAAGSSDYYRIVGNVVDGNGAGAITDAGTGRNKDVFGNPGDANGYNLFRDLATGFLKLIGKQSSFSGYVFDTDDNVERMRITSAGIGVTGAATISGKAKVGAQGWLETLVPATEQFAETSSISTSGGPGVLGATRTSDGGPGSTGSQGAWALGGFAINNNAAQMQTAYGVYIEARRSAGAGVTEGIEAAAINTGDVKQGTPLNWSQDGATMGILVGAGRDDVSGNANPTTGIVFAGSSAKWQTGIIFGRGSVAVNGGYPLPVAIDFPRQYSLIWRDAADVPAGYIRSDVTTSPNYQGAGGVVFTDGGVQINSAVGGASVALDTAGFTVGGRLTVEGTDAFFDHNLAVAGTASFAGTTGFTGAILIVPTVGSYANDTAAASAGVALNQVYRNSSFGNCLKIRES